MSIEATATYLFHFKTLVIWNISASVLALTSVTSLFNLKVVISKIQSLCISTKCINMSVKKKAYTFVFNQIFR